MVERLKEEKLPAEEEELYFLQPADQPDLIGLLGPYQVQEVIGRGGMGVVLKAYEPALHRLVAIKVLAPALAGSATARRRFARETQAAAAVCHDHVVAVHGVSETDGLPYLVMQYIAGESLQERLDREGPLEVEEVVRIGLQTASGLAAAHAQGLIHRNVKPANLLLENGVARVKITDFGLARMIDDVGLTQNGVIAGTPEYMAPEQARGESVDHRADLFSLGSVLYACCTGSPPFRGSTALAVLRQVSEEEAAPLRSLNPDVPAWLEAFIAHLMAKNPAQRFQNVAEAAELLESYLAHLRQPTTVPVPQVPSLAVRAAERSVPPSWFRFAERFPLWIWLSSLAALAVLGLTMSFWFQPGVEPLNQDQEKPPAPRQVNFHQDLRSADLDNSLLRPLDERVRCEAAGVRVTLPAGESVPPSGLSTNVKIHGDFDLTGSFEILKADRPSTGYGVGVSLYAAIDPKTNDAVSLARRLMPDGKTVFVSNRMRPAKDGLKNNVKTLPSTATTGKLRLQRVGSRLRFLVADGNQLDFVLVDEVEFSSEDVRFVQIGGNTGGSKSGLDLRLLDFTLRAEKLTDAADFSLDPITAASSEAGKKGWRAIPLFLSVVFILFAGLAGRLYVRRRRRPEKIPADAPASGKQVQAENVPAFAFFSCSGCGKRLKAKTALAGKKVKCPQCGKAAAVLLEDGFTPARQPDTVSVASAGPRPLRHGVVQRFLQRRWLAALGLFTFLGLVIVFWFAMGGGTVPKAGEGGTARQHLAFDFRAGIPNFSALSLEGPDADKVAKSDGQGLRVTLPARRRDNAPVGVVLAKRLRGDFEIVLGYELLAIGKPTPQWGAGVAMRVWFHSPSPVSAMLTRYRIPKGEHFVALRVLTGDDGKEQYLDYAEQGEPSPRGKLRLVRKGADLHYFWAEEGQDWTQLQSVEIGTQDVERVQLLCTTMHTPIALDVRLTELVIDAEQFPSGAESNQAPAASRQSLPQPKPKKWLMALAVCVVIFLSLGAAGWWLLARQSRRAAKERIRAAVADRQEASPSTAPALYFPCSACGKRLKVRAELSGQKVKCPQCGQAEAVPAADAYRSALQAGPGLVAGGDKPQSENKK